VNITAVLVLAGYLVIRILTGAAPYDALETIQSEMLILTGLGDAILIPIAWMFYREDEKKRLSKGFRERILVHNTFEISEIVSVAIMVIGISCLMNLLIALIPIDDVEYQEIAEEMFNNNGIVIQLVVIGILAPVSEELIFRGLIFRRSRDYVGFMWAAVCSGLFFGIYHGNLTQGIFAFFMGMLFAAIYEHFWTLWAPIVAHMANNIFATLENNLLDKIDVPDIAYFIFVIVIGAAGIALMYRILAGGKRVNEI
jgi:membrane protease YdiL (CAAX protease family)